MPVSRLSLAYKKEVIFFKVKNLTLSLHTKVRPAPQSRGVARLWLHLHVFAIDIERY